jgi:hypothetical protein
MVSLARWLKRAAFGMFAGQQPERHWMFTDVELPDRAKAARQ